MKTIYSNSTKTTNMRIQLLIIILFILSLFYNDVNAQTQLWGMGSDGGTNSSGTIFSCDGNGNNFHPVYSFSNSSGDHPWGSLTLANNGNFYGVTHFGGAWDSCVVFKYNPVTGDYSNIHDFYLNKSLGWEAYSGMLNANDGNLYGLCSEGGSASCGVIYKIDPATDTYTDVLNFNGFNGYRPYGALMQATDGNLYGYTSIGGNNNFGVIFRFNPATNGYTKLYDFTTASGINPHYGKLVQGSNGKLYGTTSNSIFSFDISTNTCVNLYNNFPGAKPNSGVILASNGLLYGLLNGTGTLFSFDTGSNTYTELYYFTVNDGNYPARGLMQASNGKLYGTTGGGGIHYAGVVFSYDISTSSYTKLIDLAFNINMIGAYPECELIETPAYSTTYISTELRLEYFCPCSPVNIPFTSFGTFGTGNIYTAQISDLYGDFTNPIDIGTLASTSNSDSISGIIPCSTQMGFSYYRIRVISSSPSSIYFDKPLYMEYDAQWCPGVGIEELSTHSDFFISPNPFTSQTTISFNTEIKNATIKIVNVIGMEVRNINFSGSELVIEKEELQAGIYFLQVVSENRLITNRKIVIQ